MPRMTVLMPTFNRDYLLKNSIQSILDQTFEDYEFLIIDDGSTDETRRIVLEFQELDHRILYHKLNRHVGLVPALTAGNRLAKGELIVKQDSDDLSLPNRLEVIDNYFTLYPGTDFFYHGMYQTFESESSALRRVYIPALLPDPDRLLKEQYIPGAFAYTKEFIEETPYRDLYCSDDWMLILDAVFRNKNIGFKNEGLYEYCLRVDSNSMIHENTGHYEADEEKIKKILWDEYKVSGFTYATRK